MERITSHWAHLPEHFPTSAALASPPLWNALLESVGPSSDPSTLTVAVRSLRPRLQQAKDLTSVLVKVRQASKAELREAGREGTQESTLLLPKALASSHRPIFGTVSSTSDTSPPSLVLSLSQLVPLSSVILFALDHSSYLFASDRQNAFVDKIAGVGLQGGEVVREGGTLRLSEGRWKVAMAEPVLQGAVVKGQTRVIVLPPSGEEGDDDIDSASKQAETQPHQERVRITSHSSEEDDSQDDEDFEIDESFLVNSVLTPSHHQRFGQTPLTSPLSTSSKQRQFFPLGELSASSATLSQPQNRLVAVPLQHPIPSDLLTPTPDQEEDDVPRAFLSTADLGRAGLFSGDWAVLRKDEPEAGAARLVKVFAGDGLVESGESTTQGSIHVHLPPPLLHNLLGPSPTNSAILTLEPAPSISSILPPSLPTAASLTLARIASPHSVNKLYQPLFLEGLKDHFQHRRRVINKGDVIAIGIEEGRVRYTASSEGKEESDEFELPASTSTPTAVVHFVVTALSLPSELPPINDKPIDLDEELESGALGCYVDPKVTKLLQSGIEKARVPDDGGWLGLARSPLQTSAASSTSHVTPASRLHDFISAALAPNASSYDLPLTVLVKGARGSGKRTLVYGVARQLGVHVLEIDAYDLLGDTDAKTEGRLQALAVDKALACAPCVLILRNMEALARKSQALETGQEPAMTTVLRESFATIRSGFIDSSQPVIVLGTTTDIDKLPTGVIGLFKEELSIDAPGEPERLAILRNLTKSEHLAPDVALRSLAVQTAALVANDLVDLVRRAKAAAAERVLSLLGPPSADSTGDTVSSAATSTPSSSPTLGDVMNSGFSLTLDDFSKALEAARSSYSESIGAPKIPNVTWDDVGGLANVKSDILDTIQLPLEKPELFADGLKKRSGILLYGPPGTGKTLLAKAVATSCSLNFFSVKGPELLNMYIGESEANVRRVFQRARDAKPCVIFFDELDSVAPKRGNQGDSGGVMDRIVSQLLAELDGMSEGKGGNDVFVIGATNRPDLLDPALLRPGRFDRMLYLGISETHRAQLKIIEALTRKFKLEPEIRLDLVAEQCPYNYTGADFYALCSDAMLKAMSRKAEDIDRKIADLNSRPPYSNGQTAPLTPQYYLAEMATPAEIEVLVAQQDFEAALAELIPSVSPQELSHYKQVRAKFSTETMNSDDKMEKKNLQQNGSVKGLIEKSRPLREKVNGLVNGNGGGIPEEESEDGEEEEERKRKSLAKGKGKAREQ